MSGYAFCCSCAYERSSELCTWAYVQLSKNELRLVEVGKKALCFLVDLRGKDKIFGSFSLVKGG